MRWCQRCGATYPPNVMVCQNDGTPTIAIAPQPPQQQWAPAPPQTPAPFDPFSTGAPSSGPGFTPPPPQQLPMPGYPAPVYPTSGYAPPPMQQPMPPTMQPPMPMPGPAAPWQPQGIAPPSATPADPFIGKMTGNFQLLKKLGAGGMGAVYEGRHPLVGNRVAVKVMGGQFAGDRDLIERFLGEARSLNKVSHPNIVRVVDLGQHPEGFYYCVMEFLEGETLGEHLRRTRPPIQRSLKLLAQIADALAAAHQAGIVHRDLKPPNIMLVKGDGGPDDLVAKLVDFGIAKASEGAKVGQTVTGAVIGTPAYMSPEQAAGRITDIDHRSDLYSFGVVAYETLTGQHPFEGKGLGELIAAHISSPPKPIAKRHGIPEWLDRLVMRLLEKKREMRPKDAKVVGADLRAGLDAMLAGRPYNGLSMAPVPAGPMPTSAASTTRPSLAPVAPAASTPAPAGPRLTTAPAPKPLTSPVKPAAPRPREIPVALLVLVGIVLVGGAVAVTGYMGVWNAEKVVGSAAASVGLKPETVKVAPSAPPELDGSRGAFAASDKLTACRDEFDAFGALPGPDDEKNVEPRLAARLAAFERLRGCFTNASTQMVPSSRWASTYLWGVAARDFARQLDRLPVDLKIIARSLKDDHGAAPYFFEQYAGMARTAFEGARPDAPEAERPFIDKFIVELGGTLDTPPADP